MFGVIKINQDAPNFSLSGVLKSEKKVYELNNFQSKWLLVFFYSGDFSPKSREEILELDKYYLEFKNLNCEVVAISTDSVLSHLNWIKTLDQQLKFPVLSDKHHAASIDYNVFEDESAQPFDSVFLINPERKIQWIQICNQSVKVDFDYAFKVLKQSL